MPNWQARDRLTQIAWHSYVFGGLTREIQPAEASRNLGFSAILALFRESANHLVYDR